MKKLNLLDQMIHIHRIWIWIWIFFIGKWGATAVTNSPFSFFASPEPRMAIVAIQTSREKPKWWFSLRCNTFSAPKLAAEDETRTKNGYFCGGANIAFSDLNGIPFLFVCRRGTRRAFMLLSLRKTGYGTETKVQMHTEYAFYFLVRRRSRKPQCVLFLYRFGMRIFWNGGVYVLYVETARMRFRRLFFSIAKVEEPAGKQTVSVFVVEKESSDEDTAGNNDCSNKNIIFCCFLAFMRMVHDTAHIWRWKKWFFRGTDAGNTGYYYLWQRRSVALQQRLKTCAMHTFFFMRRRSRAYDTFSKTEVSEKHGKCVFRLIFSKWLYFGWRRRFGFFVYYLWFSLF